MAGVTTATHWLAALFTLSLLLSPATAGSHRPLLKRRYNPRARLLSGAGDPYSSAAPPPPPSLQYDFYRDKCPRAEEIVRSTMSLLYAANPSLAPALLRLVFHDCFIHGCDASVLLGPVPGAPRPERDAKPNQSLRGFDAIDAVKSKLEAACPATVSCADALVLSARDAVALAGGPYYPLLTGRRDSRRSFHRAVGQIPSPNNSYSDTLAGFATRGFTDRETVALLGAHSFGTIHCEFFRDRLYNFDGTGQPDGSMDTGMLEEMRVTCGDAAAGVEMDLRPGERSSGGWEWEGQFDGHYYRRLLEGRGILRSDQQLTAGRTVRWVRAYADNALAFRADFARAMAKLSDLGAITGARGVIRTQCSAVPAPA